MAKKSEIVKILKIAKNRLKEAVKIENIWRKRIKKNVLGIF